MSNEFKHKCIRRSAGRRAVMQNVIERREENIGGGSGGGPDAPGPEDGGHSRYYDGTFAIAANQLQFTTRPAIPPAIPSPYLISLLSAGLGINGRVEVGGSQGVRVTAGPPMLPPASSESTNGVEVIVGELQEINIQRGLITGVDQQIMMTPGNIVIDGGVGPVMVKSLTNITLQVAGGLSSITMTPAGIIIQGLLVAIN
jgi:hypothetical protein